MCRPILFVTNIYSLAGVISDDDIVIRSEAFIVMSSEVRRKKRRKLCEYGG
jgi:hypothetical protein